MIQYNSHSCSSRLGLTLLQNFIPLSSRLRSAFMLFCFDFCVNLVLETKRAIFCIMVNTQERTKPVRLVQQGHLLDFLVDGRIRGTREWHKLGPKLGPKLQSLMTSYLIIHRFIAKMLHTRLSTPARKGRSHSVPILAAERPGGPTPLQQQKSQLNKTGAWLWCM